MKLKNITLTIINLNIDLLPIFEKTNRLTLAIDCDITTYYFRFLIFTLHITFKNKKIIYKDVADTRKSL